MSIFGDIVALAKAGFTPAEVKELMAMDKQNPEPEKQAENSEKDPKQPEPAKAPEKAPGEKADPEQEDKKPADDIAAMKKTIEDLQKQLQAAQKNNTQKDNSKDLPDPAKTIEDVVRSFM